MQKLKKRNTDGDLNSEIEELRARLREAEDTINAIRKGEVDAIVVSSEDGDKIFSIASSETPYRIIIENMEEGAVTVSSSGIILYCNNRFSEIAGISPEKVIGNKFSSFISEDYIPELERLLHFSLKKSVRGQLKMASGEKTVRLSFSPLPSNIEGEICVVVSDITEISNYQKYLKEIVDERTSELRIANMHLHSDLEKLLEAENALQASEKLFRSAFDEGAVPMTLSSVEGRYLKVNRAFSNLTGYTEEELLQLDYTDITCGEDLVKANKARNELLKEVKTVFQSEIRYIRKDGKAVWVSISIAPVKDAEGKVECFVTHIQNIHKRKNAEHRLRVSKERFRQLANSIPQLAWIARSDGYIFWFNQRWYEYTGKSPEAMIGLGWQTVLHPDTLEHVNGNWKSDIMAGKATEMVSFIKGKDGIFHEFLTKSIPIVSEDGNVEQWFGTHTDISELRRVENELIKSGERLNIALENGQIGTWEWDSEKNRLYLDQRTEEMFGYQPGESMETSFSFDNIIHEEDLYNLRNNILKALDSSHQFEAIFRSRRKQNYLSIKALINRDDDGKVTGISGVCFDISGMQRNVEEALIKINEELLRSNTDLQQFAYVASHDLQEPLRMVSSFTQLLQKKYGDLLGDEGNEYINYAVDGSKRMYELLNGLLAYSRIQTRGRQFSPLDMNRVVKKVTENLSLVISERGAILKSGELPEIIADENQMIQLVQNLFENSLKFSKNIPEISLDSKEDGDFYIFSVTDKGIGIEKQYFERIFRIFQRLHRSDDFGGTGIGLAICKRIVERHGGQIWVESDFGSGSTFFFSIAKSLSLKHSIV
jgi:PAS domain S-box-containing protein